MSEKVIDKKVKPATGQDESKYVLSVDQATVKAVELERQRAIKVAGCDIPLPNFMRSMIVAGLENRRAK